MSFAIDDKQFDWILDTLKREKPGVYRADELLE